MGHARSALPTPEADRNGHLAHHPHGTCAGAGCALSRPSWAASLARRLRLCDNQGHFPTACRELSARGLVEDRSTLPTLHSGRLPGWIPVAAWYSKLRQHRTHWESSGSSRWRVHHPRALSPSRRRSRSRSERGCYATGSGPATAFIALPMSASMPMTTPTCSAMDSVHGRRSRGPHAVC